VNKVLKFKSKKIISFFFLTYRIGDSAIRLHKAAESQQAMQSALDLTANATV